MSAASRSIGPFEMEADERTVLNAGARPQPSLDRRLDLVLRAVSHLELADIGVVDDVRDRADGGATRSCRSGVGPSPRHVRCWTVEPPTEQVSAGGAQCGVQLNAGSTGLPAGGPAA
jgi:hypothetical protein